ncbi:MAG: nuclear transport factor 2 family protein [Gammaproteobacteria bacterium]
MARWYRWATAMAWCVAAWPLAASDAIRSGHSADTIKLTQLACEAGRAYARRDLDTLEAMTAEDFVQTDARGRVRTHPQWRDYVSNRKTEFSIQCDAIEVRFYAEVAVVTGAWTYTRKTTATDAVTHTRWTSVWTKSDTGWKRHLFQSTYINPNADACATQAPP